MFTDFEIGRIIGVDTAQIRVELNQVPVDMSRNTYEGAKEVGLIGSYIIVPKGSHRLVGIVTRVILEEKAGSKPNDSLTVVPDAKQIMESILIGTIDCGKFTQGLTTFPVIGNTVYLPTNDDLETIFCTSERKEILTNDNLSYSIPIGKSAIFSERQISINPDAFFGKHAAILGSTGSGKSCTIASIIQSILAQSDVKQTTIILIDTNGEYRRAFSNSHVDKNDDPHFKYKYLSISTDSNNSKNQLIIPYWFMNTDDFARMFGASAQVQRPMLIEAIRAGRNNLSREQIFDKSSISKISADAPSYFSAKEFRETYLEDHSTNTEHWGPNVKSNSKTMLSRIDQLFADKRYNFLFGDVWQDADCENIKDAKHILAAFIRDILGIDSATNSNSLLSDGHYVPEGKFPFYDRQRDNSETVNVAIVDLSLLASEILENITALLGRLILEFLQRLGEYEGGKYRGLFPVVLVLEEAQNYINRHNSNETESASKLVYERIAREGRKYGLSLVVASQRPSELSKTVLAQCNSFIVHRLQNPDDLRYFKQIVPSIYEPLLDQLPALAPQTALVLGECVSAPMLVKIRDADPRPRSDDPMFYDYWTRDNVPDVPVEEICAIWEGKNFDDNLETEEDDS